MRCELLLAAVVLLLALASCGIDGGVGGRSPHEDGGYERDLVRKDGVWVRSEDLPAIARGFTRVDSDYLSPDDLARTRAGLHRCGPDWFGLKEAEDYHSITYRWWTIPRDDFVAYSTCDRGTTGLALDWMTHTLTDLERIFGVTPKKPMTVILLRNLEQYNAFGIERPRAGRTAPDTSGLSSFHYAFPCESWLDPDADDEFPGAACCYWDVAAPNGNDWGPLAVRHAAAHAFVEQIDPSPAVIRAYREKPLARFNAEAFWREKRLPRWLRYGAASYCERYFIQDDASNPRWARDWTLDAVAEGGGVVPLDVLFAFDVGPAAPAASARLVLQAGLVVAFLLDGAHEAVVAAHESLRAALRAGRGVRDAADHLEEVLRRCERALHAYASKRS